MAVINLPFIQQQMIRYGMTVYLGLGVLGNICNCIMFTRQPYRRTASSIYFLSFSFLAIIYLIWAVAPLIYTLNYPDPQTQSLVFCKMRLYIGHVLGVNLRYIIVCVCADRFLFTQINVHIRSLNSVSIAIKLVLIICTVWLVAAIHMPILMYIRNGVCGMFGLYKLIYAIYQITLVSILPPVLMSTFSILTIRSLHQRRGIQARVRQKDRYLLRMVIAEVIVNVVTSIPYSINLVYNAVTYYVTNKSVERLEIESFITFITQFLAYLVSVAPFYLFMLTSKPFRNEFFKIFVKCWDKYILRRVRIVPLNEQNHIPKTNGRTIHDKQ
jgi:hypothetical protein